MKQSAKQHSNPMIIEAAKKARRAMRKHVSNVLACYGLCPEVYIWPPRCDPGRDRIIVRESVFADSIDETILHALSNNGIQFDYSDSYMVYLSIPIDQEVLPLSEATEGARR